MKVEISIGEVEIQFRHYHSDRRVRATSCQIFVPVAALDGRTIAGGVGIAYCSFSDNFTKAVGRKLSLARALKSSSIVYSDRAKIWESYFASHNDLKKTKSPKGGDECIGKTGCACQ